MTPLIDYTLDDLRPSNPDGTMPTTVHGARIVDGPAQPAARAPKALAIRPGGGFAVDVSALDVDRHRFSVRLVFRIDAEITRLRPIVSCGPVPFTLTVGPAAGSGGFVLAASVRTAAHGAAGADTTFAMPMRRGTWYEAELAYDADTLALFVDGALVAVRAFPDGTVRAGDATTLTVRAPGRRARRTERADWDAGCSIAALRWSNGIDRAREQAIDERRRDPEWALTRKHTVVRGVIGEPRAAAAYDETVGTWRQDHARGILLYAERVGVAFELHGAIAARYRALDDRGVLGYLVSDEIPAADPSGRKSVFSRGAIYWSPGTGASLVTDRLYATYEAQGESGVLGFPVAPEVAVSGGRMQRFEHARLYLADDVPAAHVARGATLDHFLATGGVDRWGFPTSDEHTVTKTVHLPFGGSAQHAVGACAAFERGTVYRSERTGAHWVHGRILRAYADEGGPAGSLGFPTTDVVAVPGARSGDDRCCSFERGTILHTSKDGDDPLVVRPFDVYVDRIDSQNTEGFGMGQNELFCLVQLHVDQAPPLLQWLPGPGTHYPSSDIVEVDEVIGDQIVPNAPDMTVTLVIEVLENNDPLDHEFLGRWEHRLDVHNAWGLRPRLGQFASGRVGLVNNITGAVRPEVDVRPMAPPQRFWGTGNPTTAEISYRQYATAFTDVDETPEAIDPIDWLTGAFYDLVVKGLASGGNCYGMSLEALYAWRHRSRLTLPLDQYKWDDIKSEVNIKHCYQVGSSAVWWFVGQFVSGATDDPVRAFTASRAAARRGDHPLLCMSKNADFSGVSHCVLPIAWHDDRAPWTIELLDPNHPGEVSTLTVDPAANTYSYEGYGRRLQYVPYSVLSSAPSTPVQDLILLLTGGLFVIFGSDASTTGIDDADGNDLRATGERARTSHADGGSLAGYVVDVPGFDRGAVASHALVQVPSDDVAAPMPTDVTHRLRARRPGHLRYAAAHGVQDVRITSELATAERVTVGLRALGTAEGRMRIAPDRDRTMSLRLRNRLAPSDHMAVQLDGLRATRDRPADVRLAPGLGALDIVAPGRSTPLVTIEGAVAGRRVRRRFEVPVEGGARLTLAPALTDDRLVVARITEILGAADDVRIIDGSS